MRDNFCRPMKTPRLDSSSSSGMGQCLNIWSKRSRHDISVVVAELRIPFSQTESGLGESGITDPYLGCKQTRKVRRGIPTESLRTDSVRLKERAFHEVQTIGPEFGQHAQG